jgi:arylsulfatase A-like enzyme
VPRDPKSNSLAPKDLTFFPGLDEERLLRRKQFLQQLDHQERRMEQESIAASSSSPLEQAYRMTLNRDTRSAFRLEDESPKTHARYGDRLLGQSCLLARRLVERSVSFINIHNSDWDTHADLVLRLKEGYAGAKIGVGLIPTLDHAVTALIEDLEERGLLDSTLVVVMGEFGRTPKINSTGGRDHWPRVFSVLMAGGGLKRGYVHGASDRTGESPLNAPVTPADLACTIYARLGIAAETTLTTTDGRPIRVNQGGQIVRELIA